MMHIATELLDVRPAPDGDGSSGADEGKATAIDTTPVNIVADAYDADVYFVSSPIDRALVDRVVEAYASAQQRTNAVLILTTSGGDPDAAYILARFFKHQYKVFYLFVFGYCKSAGTLIALGADEIVMSVRGELGPLDVQVYKDDEILRQNSVLDVIQSVPMVVNQAYAAFEETFLRIIGSSGGVVTTRTAAEIATALATQLLSPISAQIDPLKLGEVQRAINIAEAYGVRLGASPSVVQQLITGYPSHGFVIDIEEAQKLFGYVRQASEHELVLENFLAARTLHIVGADLVHTPPSPGNRHICTCLTRRTPLNPNDDGGRNVRADDDPEVAAGAVQESSDHDAEPAPQRPLARKRRGNRS